MKVAKPNQTKFLQRKLKNSTEMRSPVVNSFVFPCERKKNTT